MILVFRAEKGSMLTSHRDCHNENVSNKWMNEWMHEWRSFLLSSLLNHFYIFNNYLTWHLYKQSLNVLVQILVVQGEYSFCCSWLIGWQLFLNSNIFTQAHLRALTREHTHTHTHTHTHRVERGTYNSWSDSRGTHLLPLGGPGRWDYLPSVLVH